MAPQPGKAAPTSGRLESCQEPELSAAVCGTGFHSVTKQRHLLESGTVVNQAVGYFQVALAHLIARESDEVISGEFAQPSHIYEQTAMQRYMRYHHLHRIIDVSYVYVLGVKTVIMVYKYQIHYRAKLEIYSAKSPPSSLGLVCETWHCNRSTALLYTRALEV